MATDEEVYEVAQMIYEDTTEDKTLTWPHVDDLQYNGYTNLARQVIIQLDTVRENAAKGK